MLRIRLKLSRALTALSTAPITLDTPPLVDRKPDSRKPDWAGLEDISRMAERILLRHLVSLLPAGNLGENVAVATCKGVALDQTVGLKSLVSLGWPGMPQAGSEVRLVGLQAGEMGADQVVLGSTGAWVALALLLVLARLCRTRPQGSTRPPPPGTKCLSTWHS